MRALRYALVILIALAQPVFAQDKAVDADDRNEQVHSQSIGEIIGAAAKASVVSRREQSLASIDREASPEAYAATETLFRLLLVGLEQGYTSDIAIAVPGPEEKPLLRVQSQVMTGDMGRGRHVWASVTKQIVATMVLQQVERNRIALDAFVTSYLILPPVGERRPPTIRELLQHRSGLRNAEADAGDTTFYSASMTNGEREAWCLEGRTQAPQSQWRYNNCDYIVLGAVLESVSGQSFDTLFAQRIAEPAQMQEASLWTESDTMDWAGRGEPPAPEGLAGYGTSAALVGRTSDMLAFSIALLDGRLLGEKALEEMWRSDPALGYMALGQWVYTAQLAGCAEPVRIVERRGGIGRYSALNIILPDLDRVLVLTNDTDGMDYGTIWAQEGLAYDMVSTLACKVGT